MFDEYPMDVDESLITDSLLVYRMRTPLKLTEIDPDASLEERLSVLEKLITEDETDRILAAMEAAPEVKQTQPEVRTNRLMELAVNHNNLAVIKWLQENCADCAFEKTGARILHELFEFTTTPWRAMNAETFQYLYEQGGVEDYLRDFEGTSIVAQIASYWIPGKEQVYSDYTIVEDDREFDDYRKEQRREKLLYLFSKGHSVNEVEANGATAFSKAAAREDVPQMEFLIENGMDPSVGQNPLGSVTGRTDPDFIRRLVGYGFSPKGIIKSHYSAPNSDLLLTRIVQSERGFKPELMALIDEYELDVNAVDSQGNDAITYAAYEFGKEEQPFTDYLEARGAQKTDRYYYQVLIDSLLDNKTDIVKEILEINPALANGLPDKEKGCLLYTSPSPRDRG